MKQPLLSLSVTVFNLKDYVGQCLSSILEQDFHDYELLVADNGSTDGSVEICEDFAAKYPDKMRFFKLEPPTVFGRALRKTFREATGKYIHIIDGDDFLPQGYFENVTRVIAEKTPDIIMGTFTGVSSVEGVAPFKDVLIEPEKINDATDTAAVKYILELPTLTLAHWRFIYLSKFIKNGLTEDDRYSSPRMVYSDAVITVSYLIKAKKIAYTNEPIYCYRRREGSLSNEVTSATADRLFNAFWQMHLYTLRNYYFLKNSGYIRVLGKRVKRYLNFFLPYCKEFRITSKKSFQELNTSILSGKHREKLNKSHLNMRLNLNVRGLNRYRHPDITALSKYMLNHGFEEGVHKYYNYKEKQFLLSMEKHRSKRILIFPAGRVAELTVDLLQTNMFTVSGFIDNDEKKDGLMIKELPCRLPEFLASLSETEKKETTVVISSIYENVAAELRAQVRSAGIGENNIIIKE